MSIQIAGAGGTVLQTDTTPQAARVILYDPNGNPVVVTDAGAITPGNRGGVLNSGSDYKTARLIRASSAGTLRTSDDALLLYDSTEGAAVDTTKWIQTTTTMTITQAAATGILLNAGSSAAATVGAMHTSHRRVSVVYRSGLVARFKARPTAHFTNNLHELGFGTPASATAAAIGDGACWRKDGTGQWVPVISINGAEILGTPVSDATFVAAVPATNYAIFEVQIFDERCHFVIYTQAGVIVSDQNIDFSGTGTAHFAVTHLQVLYRTYNSGATGTAVQLFVKQASVYAIDSQSQRPWDHTMAIVQGYGGVVNPTTYAQNANSVNNTTPTSRTLSNTAAGETTLGGDIVATAMATATTDLIMFGWTNPSPYIFMFNGIIISVPLNQVVAVATTATVFQYGMAFNSSAVSLATGAPYTPMRVALPGFHTAAIALGINALFTGAQIEWRPNTPIPVMPGRLLHVFCRCLIGTATATETFRWGVTIDGYFD